MADLWRDFWVRDTGPGQQVAQLHDRYIMMMMMKIHWDVEVASYMKCELGSARSSYCAIIPWKVFRGKMNKQEEKNFSAM